MSEWMEYKLKDLGFLQRGRSRHRPRYAFHLYGGKYPFIQTGEIREAAKYITKYEQTYSEEGLKQSKLWPKGTLCITIAANIAELAILDIEACFPDSVLGFIVDEKIADLDFIYYTLTHFQRELKHIGEGSVQDNINLGTFEDVLFPIPPLTEQTAIASILSSLDDKIDLLHRQNATLEKMAETLFRQWFVEEAKEEWEEGKLSGLVESANTGLDAIRRAPIVENFTGIKCLRIQDISQSKPMSNWGNTAVSESDFVKAQLKKGDIIMARTCSPGILLHIQEDLSAVFNNGLARIRANKNNCHPLFLKYLFKTDLFINHIYGISDGTAVQLNMKLGDLLSFELSIPPKEVLNSYIEIVQEWDDKILINQTQIRTLTQLRDTLLPKLMSGEVQVEV